MDPITAAIVAALSAGVASGAGEVGKKVIVDAYGALNLLSAYCAGKKASRKPI